MLLSEEQYCIYSADVSLYIRNHYYQRTKNLDDATILKFKLQWKYFYEIDMYNDTIVNVIGKKLFIHIYRYIVLFIEKMVFIYKNFLYILCDPFILFSI